MLRCHSPHQSHRPPHRPPHNRPPVFAQRAFCISAFTCGGRDQLNLVSSAVQRPHRRRPRRLDVEYCILRLPLHPQKYLFRTTRFYFRRRRRLVAVVVVVVVHSFSLSRLFPVAACDLTSTLSAKFALPGLAYFLAFSPFSRLFLFPSFSPRKLCLSSHLLIRRPIVLLHAPQASLAGLVWSGLAWSGHVWFGLVWSCLV
jgi:hypothetical protein